MASKVFLLIFAFSASTPCDAADTSSAFRGKAAVEVALLTEIARNFGHGEVSVRVSELEAMLGSTYRTLPKNKNGKLGHSAARFALRRFFSQQHGWRIGGLESSNTSSPDIVLKEKVPMHVQDLFEQRLAGKGLDLHELAVLVATLERIADTEATVTLADIFTGYDITQSRILVAGEAEQVINTYLSLLVYNNQGVWDKWNKTTQWSILPYGRDPIWDDMRIWASDVMNCDTYLERNSRNPFEEPGTSFNHASVAVAKIGTQFAQWQRHECRVLKDALMEVEDAGTGRVRLDDYYAHQLAGNVPEPFRFDEKVELLKDLDVLDETDPASPKIIIANYILAAVNCHVTAAVYYDICCINECEALMGNLERKIASTGASPNVIAGLVANLASDTVSAGRNLSSTLLQRLHQIAEVNGGLVPVHGRLFAQWMHHAYPVECPHPQSHGVAQSLDREIWGESGSGLASKEFMLEIAGDKVPPPVANSSKRRLTNKKPQRKGFNTVTERAQWDVEEGQWNVDESLLEDSPVEGRSKFKLLVRSAMLLILLGSFLLVAVQTFLSSSSSTRTSTDKTSLVV